VPAFDPARIPRTPQATLAALHNDVVTGAE
jgi:hypothetical protein